MGVSPRRYQWPDQSTSDPEDVLLSSGPEIRSNESTNFVAEVEQPVPSHRHSGKGLIAGDVQSFVHHSVERSRISWGSNRLL